MEEKKIGVSTRSDAVTGFVTYGYGSLTELRGRLGLTMSLEKLNRVKAYYTNVERRDPLVCELAFLDGLSMASRLPLNVEIDELFAEDAEVGRTFAELASHIPRKTNVTLPLISKAADVRLKRYVSAASRGHRTSDKRRAVLVFLSAYCTDLTPEAAVDAFERVLASVRIYGKRMINDGGIVGAALSMCGSAFIDISVLSGARTLHSPAIASRSFADSFLVSVDPYGVGALARSAADEGLYCCTVGRPSESGRLTLDYGSGYPLSFEVGFLRMMLAESGDTVYIKDIPNGECEKRTSVCIEKNEMSVSATVAEPSFYDGLCLPVELAGKLIAAGADPGQIDLSVEFDADPDIGADVAALLGLYRAQTELCLPSGSTVTENARRRRLSLTASTDAPQEPVPDAVASDMHGEIWALPPRAVSPRMPNMRDMSGLFGYVASLIRAGAVRSARFVGREGAHAALSKMIGVEVCTLPCDLPFGTFLVESSGDELSGIRVFGAKNK